MLQNIVIFKGNYRENRHIPAEVLKQKMKNDTIISFQEVKYPNTGSRVFVLRLSRRLAPPAAAAKVRQAWLWPAARTNKRRRFHND